MLCFCILNQKSHNPTSPLSGINLMINFRRFLHVDIRNNIPCDLNTYPHIDWIYIQRCVSSQPFLGLPKAPVVQKFQTFNSASAAYRWHVQVRTLLSYITSFMIFAPFLSLNSSWDRAWSMVMPLICHRKRKLLLAVEQQRKFLSIIFTMIKSNHTTTDQWWF